MTFLWSRLRLKPTLSSEQPFPTAIGYDRHDLLIKTDMESPFPLEQKFSIQLEQGAIAGAIAVQSQTHLSTALKEIDLGQPRPVLVLIGGASKLSDGDFARLESLFIEVLAPLAETFNFWVVDGGTDAGIMRLMGRARSRISGNFSLIGVVPIALARFAQNPLLSPEAATLEPNHTHFVLVPGESWGDESSWIARIASHLAGKFTSVALLINGGEVTWKDAWENTQARRPIMVVAGSGRVADIIALAITGEIQDERARELVASRLIQVVRLTDDLGAIAQLLKHRFAVAESIG